MGKEEVRIGIIFFNRESGSKMCFCLLERPNGHKLGEGFSFEDFANLPLDGVIVESPSEEFLLSLRNNYPLKIVAFLSRSPEREQEMVAFDSLREKEIIDDFWGLE